MWIDVAEAAKQLEARGALRRLKRSHPEKVISRVSELLDCELSEDLKAFYRESIAEIVDFPSIVPVWNDHVGWRNSGDRYITELRPASAVPLFGDGCGNYFGLDIMRRSTVPAVYFFDHEESYVSPAYAVGSSLGAAMLLLADHDRALDEGWPEKWELGIDPDIDKCPRAPPIWAAD